MLLVAATIAIARCDTANVTDGIYFCNGGAPSLYNADDRFSLLNRECLAVDNKGYDPSPYGAEVTGPLCACDYMDDRPDPFILKRTQYIRCTNNDAANNYTNIHATNMTQLRQNLRRADSGKTVNIAGSCPADRQKCVGFFTTTWANNTHGPIFGICQPTFDAPNAASPFRYAVEGMRTIERGRASEPCDCKQRTPEWGTTTGVDPFIKDRVFERAGMTDAATASACEAVEVGWKWRGDKGPLTIPLGDEQDVSLVAPAGTMVLTPDGKRSVPCNREAHAPVGSIRLRDYCAAKAGTGATSFLDYTGGYRTEPAAVVYGARNLMAAMAATDAEGRSLSWLGMDMTNGLFAALNARVNDEDAPKKLLLILMHAEVTTEGYNTKQLLKDHPPSFHGDEGFPTTFGSNKNFHIGSSDFAAKMLDAHGYVSPFRLFMHHFGTAVLDYSVIAKNAGWRAGTTKDILFKSGSHLGQGTRFTDDGLSHWFDGLMPTILNKLTLPAMAVGNMPKNCRHVLVEQHCASDRTLPGCAKMGTADYIYTMCSDKHVLYNISGGRFGLLDVFNHPEHYHTYPPFGPDIPRRNGGGPACLDNLTHLLDNPNCGMSEEEAECLANHAHRVQTLRQHEDGGSPGICAAIVDRLEQFVQIVQYAAPFMLDTAYVEAVLEAVGRATEGELFQDNVLYNRPFHAGPLTPNNFKDATLFSADPEWTAHMFAPVNETVWDALCTTVSYPTPGVAIPAPTDTTDNGLGGCETRWTTPEHAFDPIDATNDACDVLTFLPFGLGPSGAAIYNRAKISEAVATAAWPDLDVDYIQGYEHDNDTSRLNVPHFMRYGDVPTSEAPLKHPREVEDELKEAQANMLDLLDLYSTKPHFEVDCGTPVEGCADACIAYAASVNGAWGGLSMCGDSDEGGNPITVENPCRRPPGCYAWPPDTPTYYWADGSIGVRLDQSLCNDGSHNCVSGAALLAGARTVDSFGACDVDVDGCKAYAAAVGAEWGGMASCDHNGPPEQCKRPPGCYIADGRAYWGRWGMWPFSQITLDRSVCGEGEWGERQCISQSAAAAQAATQECTVRQCAMTCVNAHHHAIANLFKDSLMKTASMHALLAGRFPDTWRFTHDMPHSRVWANAAKQNNFLELISAGNGDPLWFKPVEAARAVNELPSTNTLASCRAETEHYQPSTIMAFTKVDDVSNFRAMSHTECLWAFKSRIGLLQSTDTARIQGPFAPAALGLLRQAVENLPEPKNTWIDAHPYDAHAAFLRRNAEEWSGQTGDDAFSYEGYYPPTLVTRATSGPAGCYINYDNSAQPPVTVKFTPAEHANDIFDTATRYAILLMLPADDSRSWSNANHAHVNGYQLNPFEVMVKRNPLMWAMGVHGGHEEQQTGPAWFDGGAHWECLANRAETYDQIPPKVFDYTTMCKGYMESNDTATDCSHHSEAAREQWNGPFAWASKFALNPNTGPHNFNSFLGAAQRMKANYSDSRFSQMNWSFENCHARTLVDPTTNQKWKGNMLELFDNNAHLLDTFLFFGYMRNFLARPWVAKPSLNTGIVLGCGGVSNQYRDLNKQRLTPRWATANLCPCEDPAYLTNANFTDVCKCGSTDRFPPSPVGGQDRQWTDMCSSPAFAAHQGVLISAEGIGQPDYFKFVGGGDYDGAGNHVNYDYAAMDADTNSKDMESLMAKNDFLQSTDDAGLRSNPQADHASNYFPEPVSPPLKNIAGGPIVPYVRLREGEGEALSAPLVTAASMWLRWEDYSTLRVDSTALFISKVRHGTVYDELTDVPEWSSLAAQFLPTAGRVPLEARHNRGMKPPALLTRSIHKYVAVHHDPVTGSGQCFPGKDTLDHVGPGLYRRRHVADPRFQETDAMRSQRVTADGLKVVRKRYSDKVIFAPPPPPPPPPPPKKAGFGLKILEVADVVLWTAVGAVASGGTAAVAAFAAASSVMTAIDPSWNDFSGGDSSAGINAYVYHAAVFSASEEDDMSLRGYTDDAPEAPTPTRRTWPRSTAPLTDTPMEAKLGARAAHVGIAGRHLLFEVKDNAELNRLVNENGDFISKAGDNVGKIKGLPDGVTFFEAREMAYPAVWRVPMRTRHVERHTFLNPAEATGYTDVQMAAACAQQAAPEWCFQLRQCVWRDDACIRAETPDCVNDTAATAAGYKDMAGASWTRPCSVLSVNGADVLPACVHVIVAPTEGLALTEDGTLRMNPTSGETPACVPITRKIEVNAGNYEDLFNAGKLWNDNCAFKSNLDECKKAPPSFLGAAGVASTSAKDTSIWTKTSSPHIFYGAGPHREVKLGVGGSVISSVASTNITTEWAANAGTVDGAYPFAVIEEGGLPNCGAARDSGCALLIDDVVEVPCPRRPVKSWPGQCVKPELQLDIPEDQATTNRLLRGAFDDVYLPPDITSCTQYDAGLQIAEPAFTRAWPAAVDGWTEWGMNTTAKPDLVKAVHYCAKYRPRPVSGVSRKSYTYCDNDAYTHAARQQLCEEDGGGLVYTGLRIGVLTKDDVCDHNTNNPVCYFIPGMRGLKTLTALLAALDDPSYYTIKVVPIDFSLVGALLFAPMVEDITVTNSPFLVPQTCDDNHPTTYLCNSPKNVWGDKCYPDSAFANTNTPNSLPAKEALVRGQALFDDGDLIAGTMCDRAKVPTDAIFEALMALEDKWRADPTVYNSTAGTYSVAGAFGTSRDSRVRFSEDAAFNAPVPYEVVQVKWPGMTFEGLGGRVINYTTARFEVSQVAFKLHNGVFTDKTATPITFAGVDVNNAVVANVSSAATVAVKFVGADTDFVDYAPATGVNNTHLKNVSGSRYMAGFARATGAVTVDGCSPSLMKCPKGCSWASPYSVADVADDEAWTLTGTTFRTDAGAPLTLSGHTAKCVNGRLVARGGCGVIDDNRLVLGPCDNAVAVTLTGHVVDAPFFCFKKIGQTIYWAPCAGCNVGLGRHRPCLAPAPAEVVYNRTHCISDGLIVVCSVCGLSSAGCASPTPTGAAILGCAPDPHGAVYAYDGECKPDGSVCPTCMAVPGGPGGHGGIVNCTNNKIVVGGFGYRTMHGATTHAVLLQPEDNSPLTINNPGVEVVNITEYTSILGPAYMKSLYMKRATTLAAAKITTVVFAVLLAAIAAAHTLLNVQRARIVEQAT